MALMRHNFAALGSKPAGPGRLACQAKSICNSPVLGVETIDAVADKGYFKIEDIEACENAGIVAYVPRPQRGPSVRAGLFRKDEFGYDADSDSYVCPAGQRLYPYSSSLLRGLKKVNYVNKLACDDCTIRAQCTRGPFRTVSRLENERRQSSCATGIRRKIGSVVQQA